MTRFVKPAVRMLLASGMAFALPAAAHAAYFIVSTSAGSGTINTPGPTQTTYDRGASPIALTTSVSATDTFVTDYARSSSATSGAANLGAVHSTSTAYANTGAPVCCTAALASSSSLAEYDDSFFLHSATIANGTVATITAAIFLNGNVSAGGGGEFWGGSNFWRATEVINAEIFVDGNTTYASPGRFVETGTNNFGIRYLTTTVTFGQFNRVLLRVETGAEANAGGFGSNSAGFTADLGHTLAWYGINSLRVGGVEVSDYTALSSDTGFDFRTGLGAVATVPEPATWGMLIFGFGLIGSAMRRRNSTVRFA